MHVRQQMEVHVLALTLSKLTLAELLAAALSQRSKQVWTEMYLEVWGPLGIASMQRPEELLTAQLLLAAT